MAAGESYSLSTDANRSRIHYPDNILLTRKVYPNENQLADVRSYIYNVRSGVNAGNVRMYADVTIRQSDCYFLMQFFRARGVLSEGPPFVEVEPVANITCFSNSPAHDIIGEDCPLPLLTTPYNRVAPGSGGGTQVAMFALPLPFMFPPKGVIQFTLTPLHPLLSNVEIAVHGLLIPADGINQDNIPSAEPTAVNVPVDAYNFPVDMSDVNKGEK